MIVLRVVTDELEHEVRTTRARVVLGSGPKADVRLRDAGWTGVEAVLRHVGTHVELTRPKHPAPVAVRVGDVLHLGGARVTLAGLLPRAEPAPPPPAAGAPLFGGYEEDPTALAPGAAASGDARPAGPRRAGTTPPRGPLVAPVPTGRTPTFGEELLHALRKSPSVVASLAIHGLLLLLAVLFRTDGGDDLRNPVGVASVEVAIAEPAAEADDPAKEATPDDEGPDLPELVEPTIPTDLPEEAAPPSEAEPLPTLAELPSPEPSDAVVGTSPTLAAADARTRRRPTQKVPKPELQRVFGASDAATANQKAAGLVRDAIGRGPGGHGRALDALARADILVVDGAFDHMGTVLDALRLPYVKVSPYAIVQPSAPPLTQHKVVFWNCGEALPKRLQAVAVRKVREFVEQGGYLFTTDWCIRNLLVPAFPGMVRTSGEIAPLPETTVEVVANATARDHPLLDGVFLPGVAGRWWLEQASFDIDVEDPEKVTTLIESRALEELYHRQRSVAVTFSSGRGRVLHLMGHYYQEAGDLAGTVAAHRLALNFVLMRLDQDR